MHRFASIRAILFLAIFVGLSPFLIGETIRVKHEADERMASTMSAFEHSIKQAQLTFINAQLEIERLAQTITLSSEIKALSPEDCGQQLTSLLLIHDNIERVSLVTPKGIVYCSTNADAVGLNVSDRTYFMDAARQHVVVWSDFIKSRADNKYIIQSAKAVRSNDNIDYILTIALNTQYLRNAVISQFSTPLTQAFLIDSRGTVLDGGPFDKAHDILPLSALQKLASLGNGILSHGNFGIGNQIVGTATLPGTSNRMGFAISTESIYADTTRSVFGGLAIVVLVAFTTGAALIFFLERSLLRDLQNIVGVARRVSAGDYSSRVDFRASLPELSVVANAVNSMLDSLEGAANTDGLTELPNRRALDAHIIHSLRRLRRHNAGFTVVMIDIDHFKRFNDTYGHSVGDDVLKMVGEQLAGYARRPDELAARYGGEEFALLLTETDTEAVSRHCDSLRSAIMAMSIPHSSSPHGVLTVSIGFAAAEADDSAPTAFSRADAMLYKAKQSGRNIVMG